MKQQSSIEANKCWKIAILRINQRILILVTEEIKWRKEQLESVESKWLRHSYGAVRFAILCFS